jgi:hypothetical protein
MMTFGSAHMPYDPEAHEAWWGARLIFDEVKAGYRGVVFDRQTPTGDPEKVQLLFPVVDRWIAECKRQMDAWTLRSDDKDVIELQEGNIIVKGSPQGSYGYLYVSAALLRDTPVAV